MTKKFGFTLAEVLITLGIIGVVAAMSIPTLIANTNSAKFRSQFKKTVATLNQAALMSQAQYDFDFAGTTTASDATNLDPRENATVSAMLAGTLSGVTISSNAYGETAGEEGAPATSNAPTINSITPTMFARLADGSIFAWVASGHACTVAPGEDPGTYITTLNTAGCVGYIDVNGTAMPNSETVCSSGSATIYAGTECTVPNDAAHMHDIFPVVFHDGTVEPATDAARAVLTTAK